MEKNPLTDPTMLRDAVPGVMLAARWLSPERIAALRRDLARVFESPALAGSEIAPGDLVEGVIARWLSEEYRLTVNPFRLQRLATVLTAAGRTADALRVLDRAVKWYPSASVFEARGDVHRAAGNRSRALRDYRVAIEIDPWNESLLDKLAGLVSAPSRE